MKINIMKITTLSKEFTEPTSEETSLRIFGDAFILLSGLNIRKNRRDLTSMLLKCIISIVPVITTIKSSQFHASRR